MTSPHPDGFSDEDLKRLKEIISVNIRAEINESIFDHEFLQALLHRLEAAEAVLPTFAEEHERPGIGIEEGHCDGCKWYVDWLASKGSK